MNQTLIHIDYPKKMPLETNFPIQGWIVSHYDIQQVWINPDIELNFSARPDIQQAYPNYPYVKGFVGKAYQHNLQQNNLTFHYRLGSGEFSHTIVLEPLPPTPFVDIFKSDFRLPPKVCIVAPGPNGKEHYRKIPANFYIIAVNKAVLIPEVQADVWMLNHITENVQRWYSEADATFNGIRIFRYSAAVTMPPSRIKEGYYFRTLTAPTEQLNPNRPKSIDGVIRSEGSIAGCAIQLAYNFGASEILLCGVDMSGDGYWDGTVNVQPSHGNTWRVSANVNSLIRWLATERGIKIFTLSPTKLKVPKYKPKKVNTNLKKTSQGHFRKMLIRLGVYKLIAFILKSITNFPIWTNLEIDIQSSCNRDCEFCPRFWDRSGVRKDAKGNQIIAKMPSEKVYNLIDQAHKLGFQGKIKLHRLSEGLLDKRYVEFAKYIKSKGLRLLENTNADVLRKNKALCAELDGLIEHLTIGLYDYKNEAEKQAEMVYWRNQFKKTEVQFSLPPENCIIRQGSKIYAEVIKNLKALDLPCSQPYRMMLIRYDGNVSLCCEDDGCHFDLGNVFEQSLQELWWSYKHLKITKMLAKPGGRHQFARCRQCYNSQERINLLTKAGN
jgi:radical SAM protein with 4Fe4S-binding SPASM domain